VTIIHHNSRHYMHTTQFSCRKSKYYANSHVSSLLVSPFSYHSCYAEDRVPGLSIYIYYPRPDPAVCVDPVPALADTAPLLAVMCLIFENTTKIPVQATFLIRRGLYPTVLPAWLTPPLLLTSTDSKRAFTLCNRLVCIVTTGCEVQTPLNTTYKYCLSKPHLHV